MKKARTLTSQPKITIKDIEGKYYVFLCLNEKEGEETQIREEGKEEKVHFFEYDYNEFVEQKENLDIEDVKANPEKYLDYEPSKEKTISERITNLENQQQITDDALQELILMQMGEEGE